MMWTDLAVPFTAAGLFLLACLSPGPVWAVITTTALQQSPARAAMTGLGVAGASLTWASLTMLGLGGLIARLEGVYLVLRLAGAAYLVFLGLGMIWAVLREPAQSTQMKADMPSLGAWAAFQRGYLTSITNPKAAAFFSSLFVVVLPPDLSVAMRVLTVLLVGAASALWHCGLGLVFLAPAVQQGYHRLKRGIDALTGVVLVGLGLRLALSR